MIVVDVETTGTNVKYYSIVSIGAIDFLRPDKQFYRECRVWPGAEISAEALRVNGFTLEQVMDPTKPSLNEICLEYDKFVKSCDNFTQGGHNAHFDYSFLGNSFERSHIPWDFGHRIVDLHSLVYGDIIQRGNDIPLKNKTSALNSDFVFAYVGLPPEPKPHNGLFGAKYGAEGISRMLHGKGIYKEFSCFEIPKYLNR